MEKKLTYFAVHEGGTPVEVDADLARDLYRATTITFGKDEQVITDWPRADVLFEIGGRAYPSTEDGDSYVFGTTLSTKERFKMRLKHGIQTKEEYRANNKQGC